MPLTAAASLNEACDGRCARQKRPSPPLPLPSPPGAPRDGQSTAHTKEELAYSLAQICFLNCSCTEPAFATPPLYLLFLFLFLKNLHFFFYSPALSASPVVPSVCISVPFFHRPTLPSLPPPPNHWVFIRRLLCELRRRTQPGSERERWGEEERGELGICLACCTVGTRLSVSNDALIISALELGLQHRMTISARRCAHFRGLPLGPSLYSVISLPLAVPTPFVYFY